tara:strand:+ start:168 stop:797 length:630 start_codon:yes stop_codon:yes gene_type:complete
MDTYIELEARKVPFYSLQKGDVVEMEWEYTPMFISFGGKKAGFSHGATQKHHVRFVMQSKPKYLFKEIDEDGSYAQLYFQMEWIEKTAGIDSYGSGNSSLTSWKTDCLLRRDVCCHSCGRGRDRSWKDGNDPTRRHYDGTDAWTKSRVWEFCERRCRKNTPAIKKSFTRRGVKGMRVDHNDPRNQETGWNIFHLHSSSDGKVTVIGRQE